MRFNAFKICEEVSDRIEGAVAPDGYLKSFVTPEHEELFFWDKEYLRRYIDEKDKKKIVPGYHFYNKLDNFMAKNFRKSEKYLEFVKFSCDDDLCEFCSRNTWVGPPCSRIPEPVHITQHKYLHVKDTPTTFHGKEREANDFNPRTNLKYLFQEKQISSKTVNEVDEFCAKFIVDKIAVLKAVNELECTHLRKQVRLQENKRARAEEDAMTYSDFDWDKHVNMNTLKSLKVKSLDKYLTFHNLKHCLKLKKQQKIEAIKQWHFRILNDNIQGEKESELDNSEAEMEDNDDVIQTTVVTDGDESDEQDSEVDNLVHDSEPTAESLFSTTRSGRIAGNWRLSEYFGK